METPNSRYIKRKEMLESKYRWNNKIRFTHLQYLFLHVLSIEFKEEGMVLPVEQILEENLPEWRGIKVISLLL